MLHHMTEDEVRLAFLARGKELDEKDDRIAALEARLARAERIEAAARNWVAWFGDSEPSHSGERIRFAEMKATLASTPQGQEREKT